MLLFLISLTKVIILTYQMLIFWCLYVYIQKYKMLLSSHVLINETTYFIRIIISKISLIYFLCQARSHINSWAISLSQAIAWWPKNLDCSVGRIFFFFNLFQPGKKNRVCYIYNHFSCAIFFCLIPQPIPQCIAKSSNTIPSIEKHFSKLLV